MFLPCNQTQTLSSAEIRETEKSLYDKVVQLLHPAGTHVISTISVTQVLIKIQNYNCNAIFL